MDEVFRMKTGFEIVLPLKAVGRELELTFGLVVIDVTDLQGIKRHFLACHSCRYPKGT